MMIYCHIMAFGIHKGMLYLPLHLVDIVMKAQFYHNLFCGQYIYARCSLFVLEIAPGTFTKAVLFVNRCKRVSRTKCYLKMIIKCPKKKRCRDVEEDECENVPIRKCKPFKVWG